MISLTPKETDIIKDLQSQEQLCIEKYTKAENLAKDNVLKELFKSIKNDETIHFNSLAQVLEGTVPKTETKDTAGKDYNPAATYNQNSNETDKENDKFLCTDAITTEKYVSIAYDFNLFQFGNSDLRKLLNDIETEEQNHAEKIYKYKKVNQMV